MVTTTTHKTLRGPRGGLILCNNPYLIKKLNSAVFPGTQGGPLMHIIAAKAVCFGEALKPEFKAYQQRVIDNAKALAKGLTDRGLNLVSGGTDNHLCLLSLIGTDVTGKELEHRPGRGAYHPEQEHRAQRAPVSLYHLRCADRYPGSHHSWTEYGGYGQDRRVYLPGHHGL